MLNQNQLNQQTSTGEGAQTLPQGEQDQDFFRDALERNMGNFVVVNVSFHGNERQIPGVVVQVGMDFVVLDRPNLLVRSIVPTLFITFVQETLLTPNEVTPSFDRCNRS